MSFWSFFDLKSGNGGAFFTTGQFSSFPALWQFVKGTFEKLLAVTDRPPQ